MSSSRSDVYVQDNFSEPMSSQHDFGTSFDMNDPARAAMEYSKIMHAHTQRQFAMASRASERRSHNGTASSLSASSSAASTSSDVSP